LARDPAKREALGAQGYQIYKTVSDGKPSAPNIWIWCVPIPKATKLANTQERLLDETVLGRMSPHL
jgi:hypothetical protein